MGEAKGFKKENKLLRSKLKETASDMKRMMHEKEKLLDINNQLKADLNAIVLDGQERLPSRQGTACILSSQLDGRLFRL